MEEPLFIKCEPEWVTDTEEPYSSESDLQLPTDEVVNIKVEPENIFLEADNEDESPEVIKKDGLVQVTPLTADDHMGALKIQQVLVEPKFERELTTSEEHEICGSDEKQDLCQEGGDVAESHSNKVNSSLFCITELDMPATEETLTKLETVEHDGLNCVEDANSKPQRYKSGVLPVCQQCGKTFTCESALKRHIYTHEKRKPLQCTSCGKGFIKKSALAKHILIHTGEKPHSCTSCGQAFSRLPHLNQHMLIHTGEKPFLCAHCNKSFRRRSHLKRHMLLHTGESEFTCNICPKTFFLKDSYDRHMMSHSGDRPHVCNICDKAFAQRGTLNQHMSTHKGEKPFNCRFCGKVFTTLIILNRHIFMHTTGKPYECDTCNKKFISMSNLNRHKQVHNGEKKHICGACGKGFDQKSARTWHLLNEPH